MFLRANLRHLCGKRSITTKVPKDTQRKIKRGAICSAPFALTHPCPLPRGDLSLASCCLHAAHRTPHAACRTPHDLCPPPPAPCSLLPALHFLPCLNEICQIVEEPDHRRPVNYIMVDKDSHIKDLPDLDFIIDDYRLFQD